MKKLNDGSVIYEFPGNSKWNLIQRSDGKWWVNMPMSFLDLFDTKKEAIENAIVKNKDLDACQVSYD